MVFLMFEMPILYLKPPQKKKKKKIDEIFVKATRT